jgi:putative endopeptidase
MRTYVFRQFAQKIRFLSAFVLLLSLAISIFGQNKGYDTSRMDTTVDACDDFYQYANGSWLKNTPISTEYPTWLSWWIIYDNNQKILHDVLETAAKTKALTASDTQLIGDYYAACMDEAAVEKAGISPIKPYFVQIEKIQTTRDLQRQIANLQNKGFIELFNFGVSADIKNSSVNIANASQGGRGLPNKDYWFNDDAKSQEIRQKYLEFITNMLKLAGDSPEAAAANAKTIVMIQKRFAAASKSPVELSDVEANYNKKNLDELAKLTPNFSWKDYLANRGIPGVKEVNIRQPKFFEEFSKMIVEVPMKDWKTYLRWVVIRTSAFYLTKKFRDENFNFFSKYLTGVEAQQARWKSCTSEVDQLIGESLGTEFVKKTFAPDTKKRVNELIDNLLAVYKERLEKLDWMSAATRQKALEKLAANSRKIGYPDKLKGYKGLVINRNSYFENNSKAWEFSIKQNLDKADNPVDRSEWGITPTTVNAYYYFEFNEIVFPAGVLQPPFYDAAADDALNYGGIGAVIAHEITHGFDVRGSKFDAQGNIKSWWTDDDRKIFDEKGSCLVDQFGKYKIGDVFMNGKLTLSENIADLGGVTVAYLAFQKSMQGKSSQKGPDGFTPAQRFFLGWAQIWAAKSTPEWETWQVQNDTHAISRFRVNGPLRNMPEFRQAFGCKEKDNMVRSDICRIW